MDSLDGQSICKRCKFGQQNTRYYINPISVIQNLVIQLPREWRIVFTVAYFVLFAVLLGCSVYLAVRYRIFLMYIPVVIYLLGGFVFYFLFIKDKIYNKKWKN
jgi:hypothetical protein